MSTDYARIGGAEGLERLVRAFVDRVFDDLIIGFHFIGRDRERIVRHEVEHAAGHLGGPPAYTGRPIARVHRPLPINRGHFRRRLALLRTVLREQEVPEDIIERWIEADRRLEEAVVDGTDCGPPEAPGQ
jgi:hemoglobin